MKKEYDHLVSKKNVKNLELYTKLSGFIFVSLGFNFLLLFIYWKYIIEYEYPALILILSFLFFSLAPDKMTDLRKSSRDLSATVGYGLIHSFCTISGILVSHFYSLLIVYGVELIIVIILVVRNKKMNSRHKNQKRR